MTWQDFVRRWRMVDITRLGVPSSTVAEWRAGKKQPTGWQREAAALFIETKLGAPDEEKNAVGGLVAKARE